MNRLAWLALAPALAIAVGSASGTDAEPPSALSGCAAPPALAVTRTFWSFSTTSRPLPLSVTRPLMMLLSPMKRATSSVAGFVAIVRGSAICWMRASFMTTIRSAIDSASSWLCVTWMNISPS